MNASLVAGDVVVDWSVDEAAVDSPPAEFRVYRGAHPSMMHHLATVDGDQRSYTDQMAVASGQAFWYAVSLVTDGGDVVTSKPVLVDGVVIGSPAG